jgi:hypothetical protein
MFPFRPILIFLFAYWFHMKNEKSLDFKETWFEWLIILCLTINYKNLK